MTVCGPVILDIAQHYVERWNEIKKRKVSRIFTTPYFSLHLTFVFTVSRGCVSALLFSILFSFKRVLAAVMIGLPFLIMSRPRLTRLLPATLTVSNGMT